LIYRCYSAEELLAEHERKEKEFEETLDGMRERDRRAYLRKVEKEKEAIANGEATGRSKGDGNESFDEDDQDMQ
jgi:hypothetical protein